nr:hypothetical protein [Tanacetum cinerariifolium]
MIVWIWMIIPDITLLAYVNGDHEYDLFNPHGTNMHEWKIKPTDRVSGLEGTGNLDMHPSMKCYPSSS